ncbi:Alpha/Beta hydrolase protein [Umbelopsis sp. PMI_123]|nr:Alpha/Beta hydrolase protein [Umbelopsis sp. PMI_123]
MSNGKCVITPGNYCEFPESSLWFPAVAGELREATKEGQPVFSKVILRQFPDWMIGRESVWIPFLESEIKVGAEDVIIGHSTGAIAAMRYAEKHKVKGIVLVSGYHTDLGVPSEKQAEYFSHPWNFQAIRDNCTFIIQFASPDDHLVPIAEQRYVAQQLQSEYHEIPNQGHFIENEEFDELVEELLKKL